jgi:hypothetical protein
MSAKYAICVKLDGEMKYLMRYSTVECNDSSLSLPIWIYDFAEMGENTMIAAADDWMAYFKSGGLNEIFAGLPIAVELNNFRAVFARVEVVTKYETQLCNPFYINEVRLPDGSTIPRIDGLNPAGFC